MARATRSQGAIVNNSDDEDNMPVKKPTAQKGKKVVKTTNTFSAIAKYLFI
jgi:hypothetical protein